MSSPTTRFFGLIIAVTAFCAACQPPSAPSNQPAVNSQPARSPERTVPAAEEPVNVNITLPILDALLSDEVFVNEAKTAAQLTDEDVRKLRDAARNEVLRLTDDPMEDSRRSARSAISAARKQVEEALGREKADRFLALAQQRWAKNDQQLALEPNQVPKDTRIVVNAPAYRMDIFRDGSLVKTYKIGIGYPEFPLPVGLRKIDEIIFNPTWTPPDEPWVRGKVQPGKKVEAGSKLNPLGPIKIPIGLPSLIHGGKSPDRLGTFASHGCVGLTDGQVQDFAVQISSLGGKPMSLQDVQAFEKNKTETKEVEIGQSIPVELRYETIVLENGTLRIYRDVYEKGTNTEENLRRVLEHFGVSFDALPGGDRQKILSALEAMASDARGEPVERNDSNSTGPSDNKNPSGRVTTKVKGSKEFTFPLPNAAGKGYPSPKDAKL